MRPVMQTRNNTTNGDCFAACVASVLEFELTPDLDIPSAEDDWWQRWIVWFAEHGVQYFYVEFSELGNFNLASGTVCILSGRPPCAVVKGEHYLHSIVAVYRVTDGRHFFEYVHNPAPTKVPLEEVFPEGPHDLLILWRET